MNEANIPDWCIERAKDMADAQDADYWWPWLEVVAWENRQMYGEAYPEEDPRAAIERMRKEEWRQRAASNQRVLDAERFGDE